MFLQNLRCLHNNRASCIAVLDRAYERDIALFQLANQRCKIKAMLFGAVNDKDAKFFAFEIADNGIFGQNMLFHGITSVGCSMFDVTFAFGQTRFLCNFCVSLQSFGCRTLPNAFCKYMRTDKLTLYVSKKAINGQ